MQIEVFEAFQRLFAYERADLDPRVDTVDDEPTGWRDEAISFNAAYGEARMVAHLLLPKRGVSPYQVVVVYPGDGAFATPWAHPTRPVPIDFDEFGVDLHLYLPGLPLAGAANMSVLMGDERCHEGERDSVPCPTVLRECGTVGAHEDHRTRGLQHEGAGSAAQLQQPSRRRGRVHRDGATGRQISVNGGREPVWCRCGELFFRQARRWFRVAVEGDPPRISSPRLVFDTDFIDTRGISYDISPDGQQLFVLERANDEPPKLHLPANWMRDPGR